MLKIGIAEINKTPSIIDTIDEVVQIVNKKTKDVKGFFIPIQYRGMLENIIDEIEYKRFLKRNKSLISSELETDDTLLDGFQDDY